MKIVIVGGGWAGCAVAVSAKKLKAEVLLIERTDMLLGTGLVGGIMRNNGRFTATEEMTAFGAGEIFELINNNLTHKNIKFPGHEHACVYNTTKIEPAVKAYLVSIGIAIELQSRFFDAIVENKKIKAVKYKKDKNEITVSGDIFIDATGSGGPTANCNKYGNGCAMCILRCPAFGGRVSLSEKAGAEEILLKKNNSVGGMSGSCKLIKESLSEKIKTELEQTGIAITPIPSEVKNSLDVSNLLKSKACQQYALPEFKENIILLNTGMAKMMLPYFPLEALRKINGFENARYEDPYAGTLGNSVRYVSAPLHDNTLKVEGFENLFCAGEKVGPCVGHTEAICTGTLAGYNAVKLCKNEKLLTLPKETAVGEYIDFSTNLLYQEDKSGTKCTFSGSIFFEHMKEKGLYLTDKKEIIKKINKLEMIDIFNK